MKRYNIDLLIASTAITETSVVIGSDRLYRELASIYTLNSKLKIGSSKAVQVTYKSPLNTKKAASLLREMLPLPCLEGSTGPTRLELATSGVTGRRSNQLNYDPVQSACHMYRRNRT
jgi:hypothetical protein